MKKKGTSISGSLAIATFLALALTCGKPAVAILRYTAITFQEQPTPVFLPPTDSSGNAPVPPEIENPECLGIGKQPAHATLMPYAGLQEAIRAERKASSYSLSLDGTWKFNWVAWPQQRPVDFYQPGFDVSGWRDIHVPSNWQVEGYGTPYYSNMTYIFQKDFPRVMSTPPEKYTAYKERNPVGSYRRDFILPARWTGRRIFITFDGVDAGFFLWVNGHKVGYSVNSRNAAEFDITPYIKTGKNMVAAEVYRFTSGSYLEDQDMWRLSGIFRDVTLWSTPQEHIRDMAITTRLDALYKDALLQVTAKIKNFSNQTAPARQLSVSLYDGSAPAGGVVGEIAVPALNAGEETEVHLRLPVSHPHKWTAETPYLYTTIVTLKDRKHVLEMLSSHTGFRSIELKGRLFTINGVPVKLKGVNRHEHWPDVGHAVTEEQMKKDIVLIKQANCNHVRTCHYSDDPRWYELCDEYGIYLLAEANLECHGAWDEFNEEPRIKAAIIDRNIANVESFKNHPSVIIWSLGNECGSGGSNFRAALAAVRSIDPGRPVHYEGFGTGGKNPADLDSRMYVSPEELEKNARDSSLAKPFYLCEYAHAMFNSMGSVKEYNDLFDKYPSLLGGCIWEWQDQGLWNRRQRGHPILAFGGGFGEYPNDHYFIHKGVVTSERMPKPHYPELKHAYQWIGIKEKDLSNSIITIVNHYQFIDLHAFSGKWSLSENGITIIASGDLGAGSVASGKEKDIKVLLPYGYRHPGATYLLRIAFVTNRQELWAKKGFEVASAQFQLPNNGPGSLITSDTAGLPPLRLLETPAGITVVGSHFALQMDRQTGVFSRMEQNGLNILAAGGGPRLHLWRAPHRNDDMWADKGWEENGLKMLTWHADTVLAGQVSAAEVQITVILTGNGQHDFIVHHRAVYHIWSDGLVHVDNSVFFSNPGVAMARLGVRIFLDKSMNSFTYFGRGPMENYSDRKIGSDAGVYSGSVAGQLTPYEKPMECGNHEDVRWARLSGPNGATFLVQRDTGLLQVSALPYSDEELESTEYRIDLPSSRATVLCISRFTLGVGSNSCGPRPLQPYLLYSKPADFSYSFRLAPRRNTQTVTPSPARFKKKNK